jgi:hypothetical protein
VNAIQKYVKFKQHERMMGESKVFPKEAKLIPTYTNLYTVKIELNQKDMYRLRNLVHLGDTQDRIEIRERINVALKPFNMFVSDGFGFGGFDERVSIVYCSFIS